MCWAMMMKHFIRRNEHDWLDQILYSTSELSHHMPIKKLIVV